MSISDTPPGVFETCVLGRSNVPEQPNKEKPDSRKKNKKGVDLMQTKIMSPNMRTIAHGEREEINMPTKHNENQLNKFQRKNNGIKAFKILAVTDTGIIIRLPHAFGENKTAELSLTDKTRDDCQVGRYVDFIISYTSFNGKANSFSAKFWGFTPPEFVPQNGAEIG